MKTVTILKGLPASGKTTWAFEQLQKNPGMYCRVNKDDLRAMLHASHWSKSNEKFVLNLRDHVILQALEDGKHVIVDDTNFSPRHEARIAELVKGKAKVEIKFFDTDVFECIERDSKRDKPVGEKVIWDMYNDYIKPKPLEYVEGLPWAVIVDVDGTLAIKSDRSPYDWERVGEDTLCEEVAELVELYQLNGYKIIIVTGRDGVCEEQTRRWLYDSRVYYDEFFIRPAGNNEKDSVIKKRIYDDHIKGKYNVRVVIDDRDQVVKMWRSLGLKCLQVEDGAF